MEGRNLAKELKFFLINQFLAGLIFYSLQLYSHSLRFKLENTDVYMKHLGAGGKIVFASWHQRFFGGFYFPSIFGMPISIMISQSRDGDFISKAVSRIGWLPVRGSSSYGGRKALLEMIAAVISSSVGVHIVDGPNGPPEVIKPGLISLARNSGAAICPMFVSYEKPLIFKSWDRFTIPRPFSRVLIRAEALFSVPEDADTGAMERHRITLEEAMKEGYRRADRFWLENEKPRAGFRFLFSLKHRGGKK